METISEPQSPSSVILLSWSKKPSKKEFTLVFLVVAALALTIGSCWFFKSDTTGAAWFIGIYGWLATLILFLGLVPSLSFREASLVKKLLFTVWYLAVFISAVLLLILFTMPPENVAIALTILALSAIESVAGLVLAILDFVSWRKRAKQSV